MFLIFFIYSVQIFPKGNKILHKNTNMFEFIIILKKRRKLRRDDFRSNTKFSKIAAVILNWRLSIDFRSRISVQVNKANALLFLVCTDVVHSASSNWSERCESIGIDYSLCIQVKSRSLTRQEFQSVSHKRTLPYGFKHWQFDLCRS